MGLDASNQELLYLKSRDELDDEMSLRMRLLRQFGVVNLYSTLIDAHCYVFQKCVMDWIVSNKDLSSIREDLMPLLVKAQSSRSALQKSALHTGTFSLILKF